MGRPRWATVVGVIGIIMGGLGVLSSVQVVFMPKVLDMQREVMRGIAESSAEHEASGPDSEVPLSPEFFEMFDDQLATPPWFETWCLINGSVGAVLSAGYFFACVLLLIVRPSAISLYLAFASLSVLWHLVRLGVGAQSGSLMAAALIPTAALGVIIHLALVATLWYGDKRAYTGQTV